MTAVGGGEPKVSATALTAGPRVPEAVPSHEPPSSPPTTSKAAATLDRDLIDRACRAAVLEETRDNNAEPSPGLRALSSLVSSSAADMPPDAGIVAAFGADPAGDVTAKSATTGLSGAAALTSASLRSTVLHARETHGPHRVRWSVRERRAWDELNRRGQAA